MNTTTMKNDMNFACLKTESKYNEYRLKYQTMLVKLIAISRFPGEICRKPNVARIQKRNNK